MGRGFKRYRTPYQGKETQVAGSRLQDHVPRFVVRPSVDPSLRQLAAAALVPVRRVPTGARTLSDKQMFLAIHATDSYQHDMRHFVGELQARVGVRNPIPVVPRPTVELTPEEAEAERTVRLRRYWARKRRGAP